MAPGPSESWRPLLPPSGDPLAPDSSRPMTQADVEAYERADSGSKPVASIVDLLPGETTMGLNAQQLAVRFVFLILILLIAAAGVDILVHLAAGG